MSQWKTLPFAFRCQWAQWKSDWCNKIVMTRGVNRAWQTWLAKEWLKKFCWTCKTNVIVKWKQSKHS